MVIHSISPYHYYVCSFYNRQMTLSTTHCHHNVYYRVVIGKYFTCLSVLVLVMSIILAVLVDWKLFEDHQNKCMSLNCKNTTSCID